jgi:hypothetical protein
MNIRESLKTRKGQLIAVCVLLLLSQVFLFFTLGKSYLKNIPNAEKIAKIEKEIARQKVEYAKYAKERAAMSKTKTLYRDLAAHSWIQSHDGSVETTLRRRIGDIAANQQFRLNNIGAVRTGRVNNEFFYAEIDINGSGEISDVFNLLAALRKIEPVLNWRRLDLRPDYRYRPNTGVGSSNLASRLEVPPTRLNFHGALRVLCYDGPLTPKALEITRPSLVEIDRAAAAKMRQIIKAAPADKEEKK